MKKLPGIMIYLDSLAPLRLLSREEQGDMLMAILEYGNDGTRPQFEGMLAMAWAYMMPKLDRDISRYHDKVNGGLYGTYCREAKRRGEAPICRNDWEQLDLELQRRMVSGDITRYPSADTPASAITAPSASAATYQDSDIQRYAVGLMDRYPAHRRGNMRDVADAVRRVLRSEEDYQVALRNLEAWIQCVDWHKDDGQYIPRLDNWLRRGLYRSAPEGRRADGRRELDEGELRAIDMLFRDEEDDYGSY